MSIAPAKHPNVPYRRVALTEQQAETQHQRGLHTVQGGVWLPIPVDHISRPTVFLNKDMWRQDEDGRIFRPGAKFEVPGSTIQQKALKWAAKHIDPSIPARYQGLVLGHRATLSMTGVLFGRHFHAGWANPFNPDQLEQPIDRDFATLRATHWPEAHREALQDELWNLVRKSLVIDLTKAENHRLHLIRDKELPVIRAHVDCKLGAKCPALRMSWPKMLAELRSIRGFVEDLGWLGSEKVTDAFVSEIIDELVSATGTEFADFDFHEVGTSNTAEDNSHTALQTSSGISRATGTPTDSDPDYDNTATITADATESWEEHGIFNNSSGAAMMDRNLTGGQSVNSSDQVEYSFSLTVNEEA